MSETRAAISQTVDELRGKVSEAVDWRSYVTRYPGVMLGTAAMVGALVGRRLASRFGSPGPVRAAAAAWADVPISAPALTGRVASAIGPSWGRASSRVEGLVNRVIDDLADAAEHRLVPALVSGVQALFAGGGGRGATGARDNAYRD
jgi:hypothetical protein